MYALNRGGRFKYARTVLNQHGSQSMGEVYSATRIYPSVIADLEDDDKVRSVGYDKIATLAKHYGVSSDFLLGISPTESSRIDKAYTQGWEDACDFIRKNLVDAAKMDLKRPLRESK